MYEYDAYEEPTFIRMIPTRMHCIHLITTTTSGMSIACVECEQVVQLRSPGFVRPR